MNFKKILAVILFILVTVGIGYAIYALFFVGPPPEAVPIANENVNAAAGLPSAVNAPPTGAAPTNVGLPPPTVAVSPVAQGGLTQVTPIAPTPTVGASVSTNGSLNYYNQADSKFYRINADGAVSQLSNQQFIDVQKATFDPNGGKAVIEYPDGAKILYDFDKNRQVTLPKHWEDFNFNDDGSKIAAKSIGIDENNRFLVVSNPDGSGAQAVEELGGNQDKVTVAFSPTSQVVATAATGQKCGVDCQEIFLIGQNHENFKSMIVQGLDFRPKWAPSGRQMLYSVTNSANDWKPQLWVVDAQGDDIGRNRRSINLDTWADKCVFSDDRTLFCAVPQGIPIGTGLVPSIADDYPDNIYRVDMSTGLTTQIAVPEGNHSIDKVMLSPDKKTMYFTDKGTGIINKIKLK